jgi:hypothetical protein
MGGSRLRLPQRGKGSKGIDLPRSRSRFSGMAVENVVALRSAFSECLFCPVLVFPLFLATLVSPSHSFRSRSQQNGAVPFPYRFRIRSLCEGAFSREDRSSPRQLPVPSSSPAHTAPSVPSPSPPCRQTGRCGSQEACSSLPQSTYLRRARGDLSCRGILYSSLLVPYEAHL